MEPAAELPSFRVCACCLCARCKRAPAISSEINLQMFWTVFFLSACSWLWVGMANELIPNLLVLCHGFSYIYCSAATALVSNSVVLFFNFRSRLFHCCLPFNRTKKEEDFFLLIFSLLIFGLFAVNIFRTIFCTRYTTRIIYLATEKK